MPVYTPRDRVDDILFDMTHHILRSNVDEHGHSCIEIVLVVSGTAVQLLESERSNVYPGCVTIVHPGCTHAFQNPRQLEVYNISCTPNLFRAMGMGLSFLHNREVLFSSERSSFQLQLSGLLFHDVSSLLVRMFRIYEEESFLNRHVQLRSLFSMLLILIAQAWVPKRMQTDQRLAETVEFMEAHYNEKLRLESLARRAGMSENQFLRRFRRAFDTSPLQYLLDLRMKHACALLEESDLSIDQIASSTGFYDSNYFLKLYKRKFGLPAGRARRETAKKRHPPSSGGCRSNLQQILISAHCRRPERPCTRK